MRVAPEIAEVVLEQLYPPGLVNELYGWEYERVYARWTPPHRFLRWRKRQIQIAVRAKGSDGLYYWVMDEVRPRRSYWVFATEVVCCFEGLLKTLDRNMPKKELCA